MPRKLWDNEKRAIASEIIGKLLVAQGENGWPLTFQNDLYFRVLSATANASISQRRAMQVMREMEKQKKIGVESFEEIDGRLRGEGQRKEKIWTAYLPLYLKEIKGVSLPIRSTVLGTTYRLCKWPYYKNLLEGKGLLRKIDGLYRHREPMVSGVCLSFQCRGQTGVGAWLLNAPSYDLFRGLLELTFGFGKFHWSSEPKTISQFPRAAWTAFVAEGGDTDYVVFSTDCRPEGRMIIDATGWKTFKHNVRYFTSDPKKQSIRSLISDSLRLYSQATEEKYDHRRLVAWWQLAETLTIARKYRGSPDKVRSRLSHFAKYLNIDSTGIDYALKEISEKRNGIVHSGIYENVTQEDCNFLKILCEQILLWIWKHESLIGTRENLDRYYKYCIMSGTEGTDFLRLARKLDKSLTG